MLGWIRAEHGLGPDLSGRAFDGLPLLGEVDREALVVAQERAHVVVAADEVDVLVPPVLDPDASPLDRSVLAQAGVLGVRIERVEREGRGGHGHRQDNRNAPCGARVLTVMTSTILTSDVVEHLQWETFRPYGSVWATRDVIQGDAMTPHDHDFLEVVIVSGGSGIHESIHGARRIVAGDALLIAPGSWHVYRRCADLEIVNCCFSTELLERDLNWLVAEPEFRVLLWPGILQFRLPDDVARSCCQQLELIEESMLAGPTLAGRPRKLGRLLLVLSDVVAHADPETRAALERAARAHPAVTETARLLRERYPERWRLEALAARVALDPSHLSRIFRRDLGVPPMAYLARVRAEAAANLLLQTSRSVTEIGAEVGWPDPSYFARRFGAHFGVAPSDYRTRSAG